MYSPKTLKIKNIISNVDSEYQFRNGKAIIIIGLNHDNPSQKGNGSGKSALIESLALAFTGTSIRDVKVKELINRQAKEGEVELIQYNSVTKLEMRIWRKFYSGTKSAECRIWIGEQEIRLPDINSYNKFIFDEIGLSKEDFFNFYLLVQANYSPFLRVGDAKKKEIINRFSGADSIDDLIPLVKQDCSNLTPVVEKLQKDLTEEEAREKVYQEQIDELNTKNETLQQDKVQQIKELDEQINTLNSSITTNDNNNIVHNKTITDTQGLIGKLNKDAVIKQTDDNISKLNTEKTQLEQSNQQLQTQIPKVQDQFKVQVASILLDEKNSKDRLEQVKKDLEEFEGLESEINKHIQDSVECPKCSHKFSIRSQEFDYEQAKEQLPLIVNEIGEMKVEIDQLNVIINTNIPNRKQQINNQILQKQNVIKQQITDNNTKIGTISNQLQKLQGDKNTLLAEETRLNNIITTANNSIKFNNTNSDNIRNQIKSIQISIEEINKYTIDQEKQDLSDKITNSKQHQDVIKQDLDLANQELMNVSQWETNFKNFKSFVANQSITNIEDYANLFLQQMGSDLTIRLDGFSELASGKMKEQISVEVLRGGFSEGSYGAFSGGERGRIDICVILAIQQLINLNCKSGGLDLLICDEILDQIDTLGLESIINSLQNLDRTIMIVSQNEINALKDYTLKIEKRNKISTFTT